jgi:hypothetical protein
VNGWSRQATLLPALHKQSRACNLDYGTAALQCGTKGPSLTVSVQCWERDGSRYLSVAAPEHGCLHDVLGPVGQLWASIRSAGAYTGQKRVEPTYPSMLLGRFHSSRAAKEY